MANIQGAINKIQKEAIGFILENGIVTCCCWNGDDDRFCVEVDETLSLDIYLYKNKWVCDLVTDGDPYTVSISNNEILYIIHAITLKYKINK